MKVVIVGGGKVGGHLARVLTRDRIPVVVVERDPDKARELAQESKALVIEGDGTDVRILEEADVRRASYLVAVTGSDEDNLVACQLARTAFGCRQVLARVNDPRNDRTFEALGVPWVSVTDLLVQVLGQRLDVSDLVRVATLGKGEASLIEIEVPADRPAAAVSDLGLPPSTVLAAISRGDELIIPDGGAEILPGDKIMVVTFARNEEDVRSAIRRGADRP